MNKRRVYISVGREERLHALRNSLVHGVTTNFDAVAKAKDGDITIVEVKGSAGMSSALLLRGAGMSNRVFVEGATDAFLVEHLLARLGKRDLDVPEIGQKLLPFLLPKKLRDAVTGDLTEDFGIYAAKWGRRYALRWLWWELAGLAVRRFGPAGIVTAVALWSRQKLGW